jgi:hypothetical protein
MWPIQLAFLPSFSLLLGHTSPPWLYVTHISHTIGPADLPHPSPAPHFKTFQVFLTDFPNCPIFSTIQSHALDVALYYNNNNNNNNNNKHTTESTNVKYKTHFTGEITLRVEQTKYGTAATLYLLETCFFLRYVIVNTLHRGDDDDDDDNNNNSLDTRRAGMLATSEMSGCPLKVRIHN